MKIAVGSMNPIKVEAVRSIVQQAWPQAHVHAVKVDSGVSAMPMNDQETVAGARNRACAARSHLDADMGIGLEGGVHPDTAGLTLQGWVVAVDRNGREGIGGSARLPLPTFISKRVLGGEELGPIMDELLGEKNVKQKGGAVGALTAGLVPRQQTFAIAVAYALAPFLSPHFYR